MKSIIYITLFTLSAILVRGQDSNVYIFSFDDFINQVKENHPMALQAGLQLQMGEANLRKSRGLFDPAAIAEITQKYFDGTQYYSRSYAGLRVPTWFGVELKAGYEQNQGYYLNRERSTPDDGLWIAGISVPIGQRLFIDKRRTELRKAKNFMNISETQRRMMLNDLLHAAGKAYWDWFWAHSDLQVYENALQVARERFAAVKQTALLGDRPFIDTLEAGIQVQNRLLNYQQAQLDYANATAMLEVYLWAEGLVPLELDLSTVPPSPEAVEISQVNPFFYTQIDSLLAAHPRIKQYDYRQQELALEQRWLREQLKPKLDLNYNPIAAAGPDNPFNTYSLNNYSWGLSFSMPLFLRQERGQLQLKNLEIKETQIDSGLARANINYQAKTSLNEWGTSIDQLEVYGQTVKDYAGLLAGERELFANGESSLFLVNSRELGFINARLKYNELLVKNKKVSWQAAYYLGTLWPN